jgi:hypothetical protein
MSGDYLWDRSGDVDAEVARLEELLARYRCVERPVQIARRRTPVWRLAAAAAVVIAIVTLFVRYRDRDTWFDRNTRLEVGRTIRTTASRTRIESRAIGIIDVAENSSLRLTSPNRFVLEFGTIHAKTTSPPGLFVVETPRVTATDLGCEYTLTVERTGEGSLYVASGWVSLDRSWIQSLVPGGASADIGPHGVLTPPYFDDQSPRFKEAIRAFAFNHSGDALTTILSMSRRKDALTLINLFKVARGAEEEKLIHDRLAQFVPPPPSGSINDWWPGALKASGVESFKKKKRFVLTDFRPSP